MQIGLRKANWQFSRLMKAVWGGKVVLLTERGRASAVARQLLRWFVKKGRAGDGSPLGAFRHQPFVTADVGPRDAADSLALNLIWVE
jgi:hypothetical protein